ncbi:LuxR family transcriptional regulator [Streptomyces sp. NPDC093970]|uniref:LuxR family transcriptional regulator n=1 Tax=Streptomyces sp. NPDC093970 TaxID=3155076 RepID=UPI0034148EFB
MALVFGRDAVLEQAWGSLVGCDPVLLTGPAGIGKSALWRALVDRAHQAGWTVLACAPAESESALAFAALADLLQPVGHQVAGLPAPQRAAVEAALLTSTVDATVDERALAAATRSLLAAAAAGDRRVLVAVDDAPWLDPASERALKYALRRAPQVAIVVSARGDDTVAAPLELDRLAGRMRRIDVEPLGVGALHHVLRDRLDVTLGRPLLARIVRDSGGNPLLVMELARAVLRLPRLPSPGEDLPFSATMSKVLAETVGALPTESRDAIRLAALLSVARLRDLRAAGVDLGDLDAAEDARLLTVAESAVHFSHPLYAAAVRADIPAGLRRRLHRRLADVVPDPDERARQLAACVVEPEEAVAAELEASAERQRRRGAPQIAAGLYEQAARLTPARPADTRGRRRLAAARCRYDSGDYGPAAEAAEQVAEAGDGDLRAQALLLRAEVAWSADEPLSVAAETAERALAATPDPASAAAGRIHAYLSLFQDSPESARRHAEAACAFLAGTPPEDVELLSGSLLQLFFNEVRGGRPPRLELLDRALALEGERPSWLGGTVPAIWWRAVDEHDKARARLTSMLEQAVALGDEPAQHELLSHLGETELVAGHYDAAARTIAEARDLGEQLGTGLVGETWLAGLLDAHRGEVRRARQVAEAGLRRAETVDDPWARRIHLALSAFTALSDGRTADAAGSYRALAAEADATGLAEPLSQRFEPDWIEACAAVGDLDTAHHVLDRLVVRHGRLPRPWTTLALARSRALLAAVRGEDAAGAVGSLEEARSAVPAHVLPLDRARCLLVAGVVHRRARRRRAARTALEGAAAEFAAIGALAFERRARAELARIGGRTPSAPELTATEERVARLAAQGRTNRVIADELFISPKTVEANLARVYQKLGISSRAELGAAMARRAGSNP